MNVCKLRLPDVPRICGKAFDGNEHAHNSDNYVPRKCKKVLISFLHMVVRPTWMHVISCGSSVIFDTKVKSFHLSSNIQKNSVLTHVRYDPHVEILPEAMILNVSLENHEATSRDFVKHSQNSNKRKLSFPSILPKGPKPKRIKT